MQHSAISNQCKQKSKMIIRRIYHKSQKLKFRDKKMQGYGKEGIGVSRATSTYSQ